MKVELEAEESNQYAQNEYIGGFLIDDREILKHYKLILVVGLDSSLMLIKNAAKVKPYLVNRPMLREVWRGVTLNQWSISTSNQAVS